MQATVKARQAGCCGKNGFYLDFRQVIVIFLNFLHTITTLFVSFFQQHNQGDKNG
jgi:hypothetical protein